MKKNQNKSFILICLCALIIGIGYPFYKKYYLKPQTWKKEMAIGIKTQYKNIPDSLIIDYCNCIYSGFKDRYGSINKFPERNSYTKKDKINIMDCTIKHLVMDSVTKELARSKLDSLATQL